MMNEKESHETLNENKVFFKKSINSVKFQKNDPFNQSCVTGCDILKTASF